MHGPGHHFQADDSPDAPIQPEKTIRLSLRVGEQGPAVTGRCAKRRQLVRLAAADDRKIAVFYAEIRVMGGQFSNLLTAEHSTKMADENDNRTVLLPQ